MLGWRKLSAWFLVYVLVAGATYMQRDILPEAKELLVWATGALMTANVVAKFSKSVSSGKEPS